MSNNIPYLSLDPVHWTLDYNISNWYSDKYRGRINIRAWSGTYALGIL